MQSKYSEEEVERLITEHPFWGYLKDYIRNNVSIQNLAFRMMRRERHSFHTFRRYIGGVKDLMEHLDKENPDELLATLRQGKATEIIDEWVGAISARPNFSPRSVKSLYYGVKKWAIANKLTVEWAQIGRPKTGGKIRDRIPTTEELKTILNFGNIRDKALFLTMASSGLRVGTAMSLQTKDYEPIGDCGIIHVEGGEGRKLAEGFWYWTFVTPEARRNLEMYLEYRKRQGEELKPESPLFGENGKSAYRYVQNVSRRWRYLVTKAGLGEKISGCGWLELHLHTLRKYFQTHCKAAGIESEYYDFWMGHTGAGGDGYLNDSYWRESIPNHLTEYKKAIPLLCVFEKPKTEDAFLAAIEVAKAQLRARGWTDERIKMEWNKRRQSIDLHELEEPFDRLKAELDFLAELMNQLPTQTNGGDCQRIVLEEELAEYLRKGWKVVTALPSGKVVIDNEH